MVTTTSEAELVVEFYLRALSRFPTDQERRFWHERFTLVNGGGATARTELAEDFVWSLLTCQEFVTSR